MSNTERHIIESYAGLFAGLSISGKLELIESLTKSVKSDTKTKESRFFDTFGAFGSGKPLRKLWKRLRQVESSEKNTYSFSSSVSNPILNKSFPLMFF